MKHTDDPATCPACEKAQDNNTAGLFCLFLTGLFVAGILVGALYRALGEGVL